jgi:hypothetical protein
MRAVSMSMTSMTRMAGMMTMTGMGMARMRGMRGMTKPKGMPRCGSRMRMRVRVRMHLRCKQLLKQSLNPSLPFRNLRDGRHIRGRILVRSSSSFEGLEQLGRSFGHLACCRGFQTRDGAARRWLDARGRDSARTAAASELLPVPVLLALRTVGAIRAFRPL